MDTHHVHPWLPTGVSGDFEIRRLTLFGGEDWETELTEKGERWMCDGDSELRDHVEFVEQAVGRVLITGLGIGFLPALLLDAGRVKSITIVEYNPDVVSLVWSSLVKLFDKTGIKLRLVVADANEFQPDRKYDYGFADTYHQYPDAEEKEIIRRLWAGRVEHIHFWSKAV